MKLKVLGLLIISITLFACNEVVFREVTCRPFELQAEKYWFPVSLDDTVSFVNSETGDRKVFKVVHMFISHRTNYISDTGCGCYDLSGMLLISNQDSIWFNNELRYVEDNTGNYYQVVYLVIDGVKTGFDETDLTELESYSIVDQEYSDVKEFENSYTDNLSVNRVYMVKNLGIVRFEMVNGELWTNENLKSFDNIAIESFEYSETTCE